VYLLFFPQVQVKLNTKRLYQADGYAVKELIKVAAVIYDAVLADTPDKMKSNTSDPTRPKYNMYNINSDIKNLQVTRQKTLKMITTGATLYDMLSKEVGLRDARNAALAKAYEFSEVERLIRVATEAGGGEAKKMVSVIESVQNNLNSLENKIDKKQAELERSQKRLITLKKVRPAFMDEYEDLQKELAVVFKRYVERFKALAYVQNKVEEKDRIEMNRRAEERLNRQHYNDRLIPISPTGRTKKYPLNDDAYLYGLNNGNARPRFPSTSDDDSSEEILDPMVTAVPPPVIPISSATRRAGGSGVSGASKSFIQTRGIGGGGAAAAANTSRAGRRPFFGSMQGGGDDDSDDESDMILVDGDTDVEEDNDVDELLEMQKNLTLEAAAAALAKSRGMTGVRSLDNDRPAMNGLRNGQHY